MEACVDEGKRERQRNKLSYPVTISTINVKHVVFDFSVFRFPSQL